MFGIEEAFRRRQFDNLDLAIDVPAVGRSAGAQFVFCFRERDVKALLTRGGAFEQEPQGNGCFACPRTAFQQKYVSRSQTTRQHIVESRHASSGARPFSQHKATFQTITNSTARSASGRFRGGRHIASE